MRRSSIRSPSRIGSRKRYMEDRARTVPLPWLGRDPRSPVFSSAPTVSGGHLSRLLYGARTSLAWRCSPSWARCCSAPSSAAIAGYRGGRVDELAVAHLGFRARAAGDLRRCWRCGRRSHWCCRATPVSLLTGIFALVGWPFVARGVRAIVAAERQREYVMAARALGAGRRRIVLPPSAPGVPRLSRSCRQRCCCRRSSWPKPPSRMLGSDFRTACRLGHDAAGRVERGAARATRRGRWRPPPRSSWSCWSRTSC